MKTAELIYGVLSSANEELSVDQLIRICGLFGISESLLRTSLSRMLSKGHLQSNREGKKVFYHLSEKFAPIGSNIALSFQPPDWSQWDKKWWGILFSVPEIEKRERHSIRKKMSAYRLVNLYPGFWVRPRNIQENLSEKLKIIFEAKYCRAICFDFCTQITHEEVSKLWNLPQVNKALKGGVGLLQKSSPKIANLSSAEAFKEKMLVGTT